MRKNGRCALHCTLVDHPDERIQSTRLGCEDEIAKEFYAAVETASSILVSLSWQERKSKDDGWCVSRGGCSIFDCRALTMGRV